MPKLRRAAVPLLLLVVPVATAAAAVLLLPDEWFKWIPVGTGVAWTCGLTWFASRVRQETGRALGSVRTGAIASGLLTVVAGSAAARGRVGWLEVVVLAVAVMVLVIWWRQVLREFRTRRRVPPAPRGPVLGLPVDGPGEEGAERGSSRRTGWM